jgi:hypothetical protein
VNKDKVEKYESLEFIPNNKLKELGYNFKNKRSVSISKHKVKFGKYIYFNKFGRIFF